MGRVIKEAVARNWWFYAFSGISIALLLASWFVPPMGAIDGSVIAAIGEIFAFAALGVLIKAIDKGLDARVAHGDTSLTIGQLEKCQHEYGEGCDYDKNEGVNDESTCQ